MPCEKQVVPLELEELKNQTLNHGKSLLGKCFDHLFVCCAYISNLITEIYFS